MALAPCDILFSHWIHHQLCHFIFWGGGVQGSIPLSIFTTSACMHIGIPHHPGWGVLFLDRGTVTNDISREHTALRLVDRSCSSHVQVIFMFMFMLMLMLINESRTDIGMEIGYMIYIERQAGTWPRLFSSFSFLHFPFFFLSKCSVSACVCLS